MTRDDRKFVFTVVGAFLVLEAIATWRGRSGPALIAGSLALLLTAVALVAPGQVPRIHRAWMAGAHAISRVTTPVILSVVYYLVLTPTGLLRRLAGRSSLRRQAEGGSYWVAREVRARPPADMRRQF